MIRCAIYDRVSNDIQVQEGLSLETQQKALIDYANQNNFKIVDIYTDEGITARKKMQNRKELIRLLNDVKQNKIDLILVTKLDRWFRNVKDYHNTQTILEAHNCNWKTIFEDYDTTTANGRFAINIMLSVNENECDRDSDRIKEVFKYKKSKGEWLGGKPPFGYMRDNEHHLVKNPETAPIVQEMFEMYFTNFSKYKTITLILNKYGDVVPAGSNLTKMFYREIYTGYRDGVQICEPFLSTEQYNKIQEVTDSRKASNNGITYLFASMIECPYCHQKLTSRMAKKVKPSGKTYLYKTYSCASKWTSKHVKPCIYESTVEKYLLENLVPELTEQVAFTQRTKSQNNEIQADEKKIKSELNRLNLLFQKGRIDEQYYDSEYDRLSTILQSSKQTIDNRIILLKQLDLDWKDIYEQLDYEHKKAFWKKYINTIHLSKENHKICGLKFSSSGCGF